jgi:hypothetical protein
MSRFVILTHDHPFLHWDFMLEAGDGLRTWRLLMEPDASGSVTAEALPDHRPQYLDYEGPIGGGRGTVRRWDHGTYTLVSATLSRVEVRLEGQKLRGTAVLETDESSNHWTFSFEGTVATRVAW